MEFLTDLLSILLSGWGFFPSWSVEWQIMNKNNVSFCVCVLGLGEL